MEERAFGWCVIGAGRIANKVAEEITGSGRHEIVSVFSRTQSRAGDFAAKYHAKFFPTLKAALTCGGVEGVYIATPHSVHYRNILDCVALKTPVLCEKSFTVNSDQALAAIKAAEKNSIYLSEAMWTRFNPVVRRIRQWVEDGEIGDIESVSANFCLPLNFAKKFVSERVYLPQYAGGALLDLGVYPIAYAQMLLGFPETIECKSRIQDGVDFDDVITLRYKNGAVCNLNCSFDGFKTYAAQIVGTKGKIVSPMFYKPTSATLTNGFGKKRVHCRRGYIYEFDAAAADVREGRLENSLMPHSDTVQIMRIMDECRRISGLRYGEETEKL